LRPLTVHHSFPISQEEAEKFWADGKIVRVYPICHNCRKKLTEDEGFVCSDCRAKRDEGTTAPEGN
jgi:hypothetical protein